MNAHALRPRTGVLIAALAWAIPLPAFSGVGATASYASLPIAFEVNEGQTHTDDYGNGIAVDAEGNVCTTGLAASIDRASNQSAATATFSFNGTAVTWVGARCNVCGSAAVSIDGGVPATVDTFGQRSLGALVSEPVFSAAGLDPGRVHTLSITVIGAGHVAVDGFNVTR